MKKTILSVPTQLQNLLHPWVPNSLKATLKFVFGAHIFVFCDHSCAIELHMKGQYEENRWEQMEKKVKWTPYNLILIVNYNLHIEFSSYGK